MCAPSANPDVAPDNLPQIDIPLPFEADAQVSDPVAVS
jgi:hypothetical protein